MVRRARMTRRSSRASWSGCSPTAAARTRNRRGTDLGRAVVRADRRTGGQLVSAVHRRYQRALAALGTCWTSNSASRDEIMNREDASPDDLSDQRRSGPRRAATCRNRTTLAHGAAPCRRDAIWQRSNGWHATSQCQQMQWRPSISRLRKSNECLNPITLGLTAVARYIAGSWICGAVVGAVAMILYQGARSAIDPVRQPGVAVQDLGDVASILPRQRVPIPAAGGYSAQVVARPETAGRLRSASWLTDVESLDLLGDVGMRGRSTATMWSIGMCLAGRAAASEPGDVWACAADPARQLMRRIQVPAHRCGQNATANRRLHPRARSCCVN